MKKKKVLSFLIRKFLPITLSAIMIFTAGCARPVTQPETEPSTQTVIPTQIGTEPSTQSEIPTQPLSPWDVSQYEDIENLMDGKFQGHIDLALDEETKKECEANLADFSLKILNQFVDGKSNVMISPLSVVYAFAMVANGAEGDTRKEFETAVGADMMGLDLYLNTYAENFKALSSENLAISLANSIWLSKDMDVKETFLSKNGQSFAAEIYKTPFDQNAVNAINAWTKDKTLGMIPRILNNLSEEDKMVLINAVAADAKWKDPFSKDRTYTTDFTEEDGTQRQVQMMQSDDEKYYLHDDHAKGFIKTYDGGLSFAALLPEEGMTTKEYINSLSGEKLLAMLKNPEKVDVSIRLPRFRSESTLDLKGAMEELGVKQMFTSRADFSGISDEDLMVGDALQKTFISVDEEGTKAAAATMIVLKETSYGEKEVVVLDRPFVYVIFDQKTCLPLFIGTFQQPA